MTDFQPQVDTSGHYPEPSEAEKKIVALKRQCDESIGRLARLGAQPNGVEMAQREFMTQWIFDNVLTIAQREDFTIAWLEELKGVLNNLEGQARAQLAERGKPKLVVPGAPGFAVPGDVRGPSRG